jgi:hypothetical protein
MPAITLLIIFRVICRLEDRNIGTRVSHLQSLKKNVCKFTEKAVTIPMCITYTNACGKKYIRVTTGRI